MIVYDKLWATLRNRGISQYKLIKEYQISTGQLDRLRKNGNVSTYTLNQLCEILECDLSDIAEYHRTPPPSSNAAGRRSPVKSLKKNSP